MNTTAIQGDYEFGQWVYNHCLNSAEIRKAVLAHVKRTTTCSFAAGVIDAIKERNSKSGREIIFLKQCKKSNQRHQDLLSRPCNKENKE